MSARRVRPLDAITVDPPQPAELSVIWLHGLGADGHDFEPIAAELPLAAAVRFVFPHAPLRPVTINAGLSMRAWYDIAAIGPEAAEDAAGIVDSAAALRGLIDRETAAGIDPARIVLAGFSQGGAIALWTALTEPRPLAGVLALSTYLPLAERLAVERDPANRQLPIWMAHGSEDAMIPFWLAASSRDRLRAWGYRVDWHGYPMPHTVCAEEIADIGAWLNAVASAKRD